MDFLWSVAKWATMLLVRIVEAITFGWTKRTYRQYQEKIREEFKQFFRVDPPDMNMPHYVQWSIQAIVHRRLRRIAVRIVLNERRMQANQPKTEHRPMSIMGIKNYIAWTTSERMATLQAVERERAFYERGAALAEFFGLSTIALDVQLSRIRINRQDQSTTTGKVTRSRRTMAPTPGTEVALVTAGEPKSIPGGSAQVVKISRLPQSRPVSRALHVEAGIFRGK